MKLAIKLKLNGYHKAGAILFIIGISILVWGLVRLYKIDHRRDVKELTAEDIKWGTYVSGTITSQGETLRGYAKESDRADKPVIVWSEVSTDKAVRTVFLTDLVPGSGKYIMTEVDEYVYTDLYHYMTGEDINNIYSDTSFQFDGVIVKKDKYSQALDKFIESYAESFQGTYAGGQAKNDPTRENTWEYTIQLIDVQPRRLQWLYCAPFIFAGVMTFAVGGKWYRRTR